MVRHRSLHRPTSLASLFCALLLAAALPLFGAACDRDELATNTPLPAASTTASPATPTPDPPAVTPTASPSPSPTATPTPGVTDTPTPVPTLIPRLWVELGVCVEAADAAALPDFEAQVEAALAAVYPAVTASTIEQMTVSGCPGGYIPPPADIASRPVVGPGVVDQLSGLRFLVFVASEDDAEKVLRPLSLRFGLAEWEFTCASADECARGSTAVFLDPVVLAEPASLTSALEDAFSEK